MELQIVENADVALDVERIVADEQVLVAGEAQHRIARANALVVAGAHAHERAGVAGARPRVPRRVERRVERQAVVADFDRVDVHAG